MSGIAAIIHFDGQPVGQRDIAPMTAAMDYRGPDGIVHWTGGGAALGACMMHTTAESREAPQPWRNEDESLVLVLDGYFQNHEDLRGELLQRGARLRNRSDAELLLRAYETWGPDCTARIEGEFAFIIWDARARRLVCARDHQGLRPLFYCRKGSRLLLASDFAALRAGSDAPFAPNMDVLTQLVANQPCWREETVWREVGRVLPAHHLTFAASGGEITSRGARYWALPAPYSIRYASDGEYAEHYLAVLTSSVRKASRSDGTAAFEVSGGLDSSAVFAVADRLAGRGDLPAPHMQGYALSGPPGSDADETAFRHDVSAFVGRPIHETALFTPEMAWFMEGGREAVDIPYFPNAAMTVGMYRAMANDNCRIAVNGLGGDEWLNGRVTLLRECLAHRDWALAYKSLAAVRARWGRRRAAQAFIKAGLRPLLGRPLANLARRLRSDALLGQPPETPWLLPAARTRLVASWKEYEASMAQQQSGEGRFRTLTHPMTIMMVEHASRLRAQCGIEGRHPLFSREFITFSAATPEATRLRGAQQKFTHRIALAGLLPEPVLTRTSKAEFGCVLETQLPAINRLLGHGGAPDTDRLIDPAGLQDLLTVAQSHRVDQSWKWPIWSSIAYMALISDWGKDLAGFE